MARKVKISKDVILEAALSVLLRDGYASVNIKTLAAEIGCSTQPIVWHFENMEGLRKALFEYACTYAKEQMLSQQESAMETFANVGKGYVELAVREPNLFRFLYLGENPFKVTGQFESITTSKENVEQIKNLAKQLGITEEGAARYLKNTVIYSHGVATLVATNVISATEEEMMEMINYAAVGFLKQEGVCFQ